MGSKFKTNLREFAGDSSPFDIIDGMPVPHVEGPVIPVEDPDAIPLDELSNIAGNMALEPMVPRAMDDAALSRYSDMASNAQRRHDLDAQRSMAMALRNQQYGGHTTGIGAALGGLGSIVNDVRGGLRMKELDRQSAALSAEEVAARRQFAQMLRGATPQQAANVAALTGDRALQAFGQQVQSPTSLRAQTIQQGERRLQLLQQTEDRHAREGDRRYNQTELHFKGTQENARADRGIRLAEMQLRRDLMRQQQEEKNQNQETGLRKEYYALPAVKDFNETQGSYSQVLSAANNPSGPNDLRLIFAYMKLQDPGVAVMEGDIRNARQTQGISDQLWSTFTKIRDGQSFTQDQRQRFIDSARQTYELKRDRANELKGQYRILATQTGASPDRVVLPDIDLTQPVTPRATPAAGAKQPGQAAPQKPTADKEAQMRAWLKANPNDPRAAKVRAILGE